MLFESLLLDMINIKEIINNFLSDFSSKQKDVLEKRFGLNGEKQTLAAIGKKYNLTRERVRQIEEFSLETIREKKIVESADKFFKIAINQLKKYGGVRKEDDFLSDLRAALKDDSISNAQLKFVFEINKIPKYHPSDKNFYSFWYIDDEVLKKSSNFINKLSKILAGKKDDVLSRKKFGEIFKESTKEHKLDENSAFNLISISKKFGKNPFGDFGLTDWDEIDPKTIGAKTYLILQKHGKPMHFRDIAERINELKLNKRKALPQTVHNELIRDPRFVLVGRGMYGLKESGLMPGTAKDVIARILLEKGPLRSKDIINLVLQERFLKENTILLNLQNRKSFKKLPDGKYNIA